MEKSIAGSGARAEPLEAAAQSVATGVSTLLLWLANAICQYFLMLAVLRPSWRTRQKLGLLYPENVDLRKNMASV